MALFRHPSILALSSALLWKTEGRNPRAWRLAPRHCTYMCMCVYGYAQFVAFCAFAHGEQAKYSPVRGLLDNYHWLKLSHLHSLTFCQAANAAAERVREGLSWLWITWRERHKYRSGASSLALQTASKPSSYIFRLTMLQERTKIIDPLIHSHTKSAWFCWVKSGVGHQYYRSSEHDTMLFRTEPSLEDKPRTLG